MPEKLNPDLSYFSRLKFDKNLMNSWVGKYVQNIRLVILLILTISLVGVISYLNLPKRLNPEVKIPIITVSSVLPGASPTDVESLVTTPLEDAIRGVEGIDQINSVSQQNVGFITIQFLSTIDVDTAQEDVAKAIQNVNLPSNATQPEASALDFENVPIWQFALSSTGGIPDLMSAAEALKNRIEDVQQVDRVETTGIERQQIVVYLDPQKMGQYKINPLQISQMLSVARNSFPAGAIQSDTNTFTISINRRLETIQDIRDMQLNFDGQLVRLADVAEIREESVPNQQTTYLAARHTDGGRSVVFSVYKTTAADITSTGRKVEEVVDGFIKERNETVTITSLLNTSEQIDEQFNDLLGEFGVTIALVFAVLLLFLGLRQALISSLTVPLTFLSTFFLMQLTGMTINFLSMFAFLLALGLLVDDTIVIVAAMTNYFKTGKFTPTETGILVWKDTITPIWSTTLTTIWAFVPLLLASGIIGEFIKPIPIVVTITMISSTAIAVLITLPLMIVLLKPQIPQRVITMMKIILYIVALTVVGVLAFGTPLFIPVLLVYITFSIIFIRVFPVLKTWVSIQQKNISKWYGKKASPQMKNITTFLSKGSDHGLIQIEPLAHWYERLIQRILNNKASRQRVIIAVIVYAIFSFALLPLGFVKNEFFPKTNENQVYVSLELPIGSTIRQSAEAGQTYLKVLEQIPEAEYVTAEIGRSADGSGNAALASSANSTYYTIKLVEAEERDRTSSDIAEYIRQELSDNVPGKISVIEVSGGPPAGADVQITLLGDDLLQLENVAAEVKTFLESQSEMTNVSTSVGESTSGLEFIPNYAQLAVYNISADSVASSLRLYASGQTLNSFAFEDGETETTDIVFKVNKENGTPEGLTQLLITSPDGTQLPLSALGEIRTKANPSVITHQKYKRSITISGAVKTGGSITDANTKLQEYIKDINLPNGFEWVTGGVNEENEKSIQSIIQAMVLSAVLILITMVVQFGSFRQALIVLIVIPFAISSVFLAFALTGTPLSFPALIGILSLFGLVVTNSMFIVDKINLNQREGMPFKQSIADAGASRLEPIILTKLSTVFGLLPITIADPLWRGLGGAIISGILVSSTIMLLFIPVLYYEWMKDKENGHT